LSNNKKLLNENYSEEFRQNIINARKNKNLTIQEASQILNIPKTIIEKLENGDLTEINSNIFIMGHIRTYLNLIEIDPKLLFDNYQIKEVNLNKEIQNIIVPYKFKLSKKFILCISIILFLFIIIIYREFNKLKTENIIISEDNVFNNTEISKDKVDKNISKEKKIEDIDTIEKEEETVDTIYEKKTISPTNIEDINNIEDIKEIEEINFLLIEAIEDSWIEVKDVKSKVIMSKIVKKNETIKLPYQKDLILVTGNAGGIVIKINNKTINTLGKSGEVKRNISLNLENLIKYLEE